MSLPESLYDEWRQFPYTQHLIAYLKREVDFCKTEWLNGVYRVDGSDLAIGKAQGYADILDIIKNKDQIELMESSLHDKTNGMESPD